MGDAGNSAKKEFLNAAAEQVLNARLAALAADPDFPEDLKAMIRAHGLEARGKGVAISPFESKKLKDSDDT